MKEDTADRERVSRNRSIHAGSRPLCGPGTEGLSVQAGYAPARCASSSWRTTNGRSSGSTAFALLARHDVVVHSERAETPEARAAQIGDAEAVVLIRERTPSTTALLELVPGCA